MPEGNANPSVSKCRIQDVFAVMRTIHPALNGLPGRIISPGFLKDVLSSEGPVVYAQFY